MALPAALVKIPWPELISLGAEVVRTAKDLYNRSSSNRRPPRVDPHAEVKAQIAAIAERLEALEAAQAEQAKLAKELAEQLQSVSLAVARSSARNVLLLWLSAGGIGLSCIALALALMAR